MSRHHMLPPVVIAPEPPKPKETRRKRGLNGVWRKRAADGSDEADEIDDGPQLAPAPRTHSSSLGAPVEGADRHVPSPSGKLSADTLKVMLEAQEETTKDGSQS